MACGRSPSRLPAGGKRRVPLPSEAAQDVHGLHSLV